MRRSTLQSAFKGLICIFLSYFFSSAGTYAAHEKFDENEVTEEQLVEIKKHLEELAKTGDADSQFQLELLIEKEKGGPPRTAEQSVDWYWFAEVQDPADSQFNMGIIYEEGPLDIRNYREARKWYSFAAEGGHAEALFRLGEIYRRGLGVLSSYAEAARLYRLASLQDHAEAKRTLIKLVIWELGGVRADEVIPWLKQAVREGDLEAATQLALIFDKGSGSISQDFREASRWYLRSAELGNPESQERLSEMYELGTGVSKNLSSALMWLELAVAYSQDQESKNIRLLRVGLLKSRMEPVEIQQAQELKSRCLVSQLTNCLIKP